MNDGRTRGWCGPAGPTLEQSEFEASGWSRRIISDRERIDQLAAVYQALGFETRIVGLEPERFSTECRACAIGPGGTCMMLFVRRAEVRPPPPDESTSTVHLSGE